MKIKYFVLLFSIIVALAACTTKKQKVVLPEGYYTIWQDYIAIPEESVVYTESNEVLITTEIITSEYELTGDKYVKIPFDSVFQQGTYILIKNSYVDTSSGDLILYSEPITQTIQEDRQANWGKILLIISLIILSFALGVILYLMGAIIWLRAKFSGVKIGLYQLTVMRFKRVPQDMIVDVMIKAAEAKVQVTQKELESHYLAGGNIQRVVSALIAAKNADEELVEKERFNLNFKVLANIDMAGIDVAKAVTESIHYLVKETAGITAYAKDGVQLTMKAKVTMRPRIRQLVGGAGPETVLARVDEGIVTAVGQTKTHYDVLKSPYQIAEDVMQKAEITEGTSFDIISIDISDIQVGKDIHAELAIERAHASKAKSEADKYAAIALEQEMKAKAQEAKVRLIEAEVEVQKAMAAAFLDGNLSIHDYHNMMNTEADTEMRKSISKGAGEHH